jgi:hypothetical protein
MEQCLGSYQKGNKVYPEDLFDPGTYLDTVTGDVWEKREDGKWTVNGMPHKPFPHSLVPEQVDPDNPSERRLRNSKGYCE